jgi:hypothetical protein
VLAFLLNDEASKLIGALVPSEKEGVCLLLKRANPGPSKKFVGELIRFLSPLYVIKEAPKLNFQQEKRTIITKC